MAVSSPCVEAATDGVFEKVFDDHACYIEPPYIDFVRHSRHIILKTEPNGTADSNRVNNDSTAANREHKSQRRHETEEERRIRKERERSERSSSSLHKHSSSRHFETEAERQIRKEKERQARKNETEEERAARKLKERQRANETEEERRLRKERERRKETPEERAVRKEKERKMKSESRKETEEERHIRKERERRERKEREAASAAAASAASSIDERLCAADNGDGVVKMETEEAEHNGNRFTSVTDVKQEPDSSFDASMISHTSLKRRRSDVNGEVSDSCIDQEDDDDYDDDETDVKDEEDASDECRDNDESEDEEDSDESDYDQSYGRSRKAKKAKVSRKSSSKRKPAKKVKAAVKAKSKTAPTKVAATAEATTIKTSPSTTKKRAVAAAAVTKKEGGVKKEEEEVWRWWEEGESSSQSGGVKWTFLQHKGVMFAPEYVPLPPHVHFLYDGRHFKLRPETEEVATFYGRMIEHDYTTKEVFNNNFFKDWRKVMSQAERETIRDLGKCDFTQINDHFKLLSEQRKARSKEEKKAEKEKNEAVQREYGICQLDGHNEKIGNFRIEPPGLFRGRGEHPRMGMLKKRVMPEDVIINCSKDSIIPVPPPGHTWKKVQHDNTVTWLASWTENVQNNIKYMMLNPSSKLKGEKDMSKYEKARQLKTRVAKIREDYTADMKSKEMRVRQRAVALYFIDKLALRAGNEKDEDQADTVGCCSLRVEHITLHPQLDGKEYVVELDFLGKDSIRYNNSVPVEKRVYKNIQLFMENKKEGDDLFDRLSTTTLNEYLTGLMPGLTAKVFRTYNASITLQDQLHELTNPSDNVVNKMLSYNRANRAVAVLCNHQRAVPKTHEKSMSNLKDKIRVKDEAIAKAQKEANAAKKAVRNKTGSQAEYEKKKKALDRALEMKAKLETQAVDREENKTIALSTSKLNYLDPRISVAWCKKHDVPIEKVYNKTQRDKFRWAIDMAGPDFIF